MQRRSDFTIPDLIPPVQLLDKTTGKPTTWPLPSNVKVLLSYRVAPASRPTAASDSGAATNELVEAHLKQIPNEKTVSLSGDAPMGGLTVEDVEGVVAKARRVALARGVLQPDLSEAVRCAIWNGAVRSFGASGQENRFSAGVKR